MRRKYQGNLIDRRAGYGQRLSVPGPAPGQPGFGGFGGGALVVAAAAGAGGQQTQSHEGHATGRVRSRVPSVRLIRARTEAVLDPNPNHVERAHVALSRETRWFGIRERPVPFAVSWSGMRTGLKVIHAATENSLLIAEERHVSGACLPLT